MFILEKLEKHKWMEISKSRSTTDSSALLMLVYSFLRSPSLHAAQRPLTDLSLPEVPGLLGLFTAGHGGHPLYLLLPWQGLTGRGKENRRKAHFAFRNQLTNQPTMLIWIITIQ